LGALSSQGLQMEARLHPLPGVQTVLGWSRATQSSDDSVLSPLVKEVDRLASLETLWTSSLGQSSLTVLQKQEWQSYTGLRFRQTSPLGARLSMEVGADYHSESSASLPLRLAGYENRLYSSVNYALGKREYLRVAPQFTQYYTQNGDFLGSGRGLDLEAGYRLRVDYPDWRARALFSYQGFNPSGSLGADALALLPASFQASLASGTIDPVRYFIPEGSTTWGACLSMGENLAGQNLQTTYSRAWRPFLDVCLRHNTVAGTGYAGTFGIVGSLSGEDHVSLQWQKSDGTAPGSDASRTLSLRYRHYF
jgi:polysaccharide biosynthesis protein PelB